MMVNSSKCIDGWFTNTYYRNRRCSIAGIGASWYRNRSCKLNVAGMMRDSIKDNVVAILKVSIRFKGIGGGILAVRKMAIGVGGATSLGDIGGAITKVMTLKIILVGQYLKNE